jgi:HD-GYP domain-containing protein (c-di-GMP phosphodiesterase class II)
MTSDRPYRSALPATAARAIIAAERGAMFDPALADVLLMLLHEERP